MKDNHNYNFDNEIDILELFKILWDKKVTISLVTSLGILIAIIYSLTLPNIYKSTAILASASSSDGGVSSLSSQYSSVANLAGITIPNSGGGDELAMGIKIIQSLNFYQNFVSKNDLFKKLQAYHDWDESSNQLIPNPKLYDGKNEKWVSTLKYSVNGKPSIQSAHRDFLKHFTIRVDNKTGIVTTTYKHYSPQIASEVLTNLILEINELTRSKDIKMARDTIEYLESQLEKTSINDIRIGMYNLIQKQIETIALANASSEYFLKVLSPPNAPELKSEPSRSLIVLISLIISFSAICTYFLVEYYVFKKPKKPISQ